MILKKPYAMLIKNFRKIHIILTFLTIFIAYQSKSIITFFKDYIANNFTTTITDDIVSRTISPIIYVAIIATIVILIAVYILLRTKKKPNKMYLFTIIYYVVFLIFIIITSVLIGSLRDRLWSTASALNYRDLSNIVYYPQFIFIIIIAIRSLGFNVKQFDFKNDLKELEITEQDSEEVELSINFETYKAQRFFHRVIREFTYYFKENKRVMIIISTVIILLLGYIGFKNYEKIKYTYKENESFKYNDISLNVIDSMVTNLDLKGNIIYDDKYFVLLKIEIRNNSKEDKYLDYNNLKLYYGSKYVYPKLDLGNYFLDYGDPFMGEKLYAKSSNTYIIPYLIDKKYKNKNFKLVLYLGSANKKNEFIAKNAIVKLKPKTLDKVEIIRNASLDELVSLSSTALGETNIKISNPILTSRYEYKYESCYKEECRTYTDVVAASTSYQNKQALIVLDYEINFDNTVSSYKNINSIASFADAFIQLEYKIYGETKRVNVKNVTPTKIKDKLVLKTDDDVLTADSINLLITIRDRCYTIKIK